MNSDGSQMYFGGCPNELWWLPRWVLVSTQMNSGGHLDGKLVVMNSGGCPDEF